MCGRPSFAVRLFVAFVLVASVVGAVAVPVGAQTTEDSSGDSTSTTDERRCFPPGGHDLSIGDGNPHINVTVHTSLFTSPAPPSALGLSAHGVALDTDIVALRTGVLLDETPDGVSTAAVWDSFVILFDYRLSLPMFAGTTDDSTYEPTGGPVSGVETRSC
ncbi:DUF7332 family protein [Halobellus ordinarius]|uniref:DUF7332 family protein n=1 Tax=Halobellus ordinarius TaxID=3075120 RepID=UPI00287FF48F|nr:hypothetical protein [Halobellus sp. ZY16]